MGRCNCNLRSCLRILHTLYIHKMGSRAALLILQDPRHNQMGRTWDVDKHVPTRVTFQDELKLLTLIQSGTRRWIFQLTRRNEK